MKGAHEPLDLPCRALPRRCVLAVPSVDGWPPTSPASPWSAARRAGQAARPAAKPCQGQAPTAKADAKPAKGAAAAEPRRQAGREGGPPPASSSPMAELKKSNAQLDKVLQKNRPNWSPEAELQRGRGAQAGRRLPRLRRAGAAGRWPGTGRRSRPSSARSSSSTLRELVERSYLKQVHGNANYNIKYDKEEKNGSEADGDRRR